MFRRVIITIISAAIAVSLMACSESGSSSGLALLGMGGGSAANADLMGLTVSEGTLSPSFGANITGYSVEVAYEIDAISVTPSVAEPASTVTVNGIVTVSGTASDDIPLNVGQNTITILVAAEDGSTTRTYTVVVTRLERVLSNNANLADLSVSEGTLTPVFGQDQISYTVDVENGISSLTVTPTVAGVGATVTVEGDAVDSGSASGAISLATGNNSIEVMVTAENGTTAKTYTIVARRAKSNNANLAVLSLSQGTLTPSFGPDEISYTVEVGNEISSLTITPTVSGVGATVMVNDTTVASGSPSGDLELSTGNNTIEVEVTAEDGATKKTYTIVISREKSDNADLAGMTLSHGTLTPSFDKDEISYTAEVANEIESLTVTPTVSGVGATVTVNGDSVVSGIPSGYISLSTGDNTIEVEVTAENGSAMKMYTIVVSRAKSDNANLAGLTLSRGTLSPSFGADELEYSVSVVYSNTEIAVTPTVSGVNATVKVNDIPVVSGTPSQDIELIVGENTIYVTVTAENGIAIKTYTIVVNRLDRSDDAYLTGLLLTSAILDPVFSKTITGYSTYVENAIHSVMVTPVASESHAAITVNGDAVVSGNQSSAISLNGGNNTITILVTAENGISTKTYTITVLRNPFTDLGNGAVYDIRTGMMWEKTPSGENINWYNSTTYTDDLTKCGYSDWRLPSYAEMQAFFKDIPKAWSGWLNAHGFSGIGTGTYWSSTAFETTAYVAHMYWSEFSTFAKTDYNSRYCWAVRGGLLTSFSFPSCDADVFLNDVLHTVYVVVPESTDVTNLVATFTTAGTDVTIGGVSQTSGESANNFSNPVVYTITDIYGNEVSYTVTVAASPFTNNGDGTVTDHRQNPELMWEQIPSSGAANWSDTTAWADALEEYGYSDWRLPTLTEFGLLLTGSVGSPSAWLNANGFTGITAGEYWSSTTGPSGYAWAYDTYSTGTHHYYTSVKTGRWAVRKNQ